MERQPVSSGNITSIGYDPETQTLHIEFKGSGAVYEYANVTPEQHQALMSADSIGKHFGQLIRNQEKHPAKRLDARPMPGQPVAKGAA